ncbi:MAG: threonine dehydratase [Rhodospirillales bacterium]
MLPSLSEIERASALVHAAMPPTPQYRWPLLCERAGCELWVKHENHTPIGAFKIRAGLVYMEWLKRREPKTTGVVAATRGNHGQSVTVAARRAGFAAVIVVPRGNSVEKNAAMRAQGAELVEHGQDFQEAFEYAMNLARERGLHPMPSFHPLLAHGTATYGLELFRAVPDLDMVYVPIGMGSGICGAIAARDGLGLKTKIVGVCAENAPTYALSFAAGKPMATNSADTMADGLACRVPDPGAVAAIVKGAERIVTVSDEQIKAAMRVYFTDTHNVAEGAGAAALAALLREKDKMKGQRVAVVLSGGNVDAAVYRRVLSESA